MKKILINTIELTLTDMYSFGKYPSVGFYETNGMLVIVNNSSVIFLGYLTSINHLIETTKEVELHSQPSNLSNLSEDFVLKLIAITKNKEKFSDIKKSEK